MSDGVIEQEIKCLGCGYNLRGLSPASACPECSQSVQSSIQALDLKNYNNGWIKAVGAGAQMMIAALLFRAHIPIVYLLQYVDTPETKVVRKFFHGRDIQLGLLALELVTYLLGVWLITAAPDRLLNDKPQTGQEISLRYLLRLFTVILTPYLMLNSLVPAQYGFSEFVRAGMGFLMRFVELAVPFMFWLLIQKDLAVRVSQTGLAQQARLIKWIIPILILIGDIARGLFVYSPRPFGALTPSFYPLLEIVWLAIYAWCIALLFQILKPFESLLAVDVSAEA
jgi:hypothetical protein